MNVAIIGCGGMGAVHAQMATNCGLNVVACGDKRKAAAAALAKKYKAAASANSTALIGRGDVDIVAITTPTPTHSDYVAAAAKAGKHIFCEKPFGRTLAQCRTAIAAAKKAKVKLFVGHVVRYFHEFEALRGQVAEGKVGVPGFVKMYRGGLFPLGADKWFRDYEQSGGVTLDSMIHDLDWLRYAFGDAARIFCQNLQRPDGIDYAMATVRMKSGLIASVIGTWAQPSGFRVMAEICGDKGMVQFDSAEAPITTLKRAKRGAAPGMIVPSSPVATSPYQLEWEDFLAWIAGESAPRVTPEDALESVKMALAALRSAKANKPVNL